MNFNRPNIDTLLVRIAGDCKIINKPLSFSEVQKQLETEPRVQRVIFDTQNLTGWDSGLLTFLIKVIDQCSQSKIAIEKKDLPEGIQRLLSLASAVPERKGARRELARTPFLEQAGQAGIDFWQSTIDMLAFIGEAFSAFIRLVTGRAKFRRSELFLIMQECGAQALPIVSLISLLVGLILAFVGAIQLEMFGAQIYVADLVGIAMVRVMGAIMTGIIMAGRTGASFAAQLGTMQVNEEIDALKTMGISPI